MLKDLLTAETMRLNVEVKDWEEAVKIGGGLLEKAGAIKHRYIDAMIDVIKKIGPYVVIAPGIAMPHARPEDGAKKVGISLITLKNPVNFGNKENDPVKIVLCISAVDHSAHLKLLSELAEFLQDREKITKIIAANDIKEVLAVL
jgi:mannitol/fructose-specific phosphotransferase system IIA component (Ntr-type)